MRRTDKVKTSLLETAYEEAGDAAGAERFGWKNRNPEPRSTRDGDYLFGWGMATGVWEALQSQASASAKLHADGRLEVASGTADIGTGAYTVMTQIAAEVMGLPLEAVEFNLGDSDLPKSPVEGGSWTVSSNGSAVKSVCEAIKKEAFKLTNKMDDSPFADAEYDTVIFADGRIEKRRVKKRFDFRGDAARRH